MLPEFPSSSKPCFIFLFMISFSIFDIDLQNLESWKLLKFRTLKVWIQGILNFSLYISWYIVIYTLVFSYFGFQCNLYVSGFQGC